MRVALIIDDERLEQEHAALNRLAIGLIGEGVHLVRVVPETSDSYAVDASEQRMALAKKLETPMHVLPWVRRPRAMRLVEAMEREVPDVLYAVGHEAWRLALDLSRPLDRPVLLDVWSLGQVRRVPRGRTALAIAGCVAPTDPIAEALRMRIDPALVCHIPMGIAVPTKPRRILADPDRAIAIAALGRGRDVPAYRAMLGGLSRVLRDFPQTQVFLELHGPNEHEIWRHARRLELLENVSAITQASEHRALLTECDLAMVPERYGEPRSIMLDAMACGMPVIAGDDPALDMGADLETASLVTEPDAEDWARRIRRLLTDPDEARALGLRGRDHVAEHHRSSEQVARLVETFEQIRSGGAIPFVTGDA